jgi:hypothetical protein
VLRAPKTKLVQRCLQLFNPITFPFAKLCLRRGINTPLAPSSFSFLITSSNPPFPKYKWSNSCPLLFSSFLKTTEDCGCDHTCFSSLLLFSSLSWTPHSRKRLLARTSEPSHYVFSAPGLLSQNYQMTLRTGMSLFPSSLFGHYVLENSLHQK